MLGSVLSVRLIMICFGANVTSVYSPGDTQIESNNLKTEDIIHLASLTHKHGLQGLHTWACKVLSHRFFSKNATYLETCSGENLEQLLELFALNEDENSRKRIEDRPIHRIEAEKISLAQALDAGERLSLRNFLGRAYYATLLILNKQSRSRSLNNDLPCFRFPSEMGKLHRDRLRNGQTVLTNISECMAFNIPNPKDDSRNNRPSVPAFSDYVKIFQIPALDVLERLRVIKDMQMSYENYNSDTNWVNSFMSFSFDPAECFIE